MSTATERYGHPDPAAHVYTLGLDEASVGQPPEVWIGPLRPHYLAGHRDARLLQEDGRTVSPSDIYRLAGCDPETAARRVAEYYDLPIAEARQIITDAMRRETR